MALILKAALDAEQLPTHNLAAYPKLFYAAAFLHAVLIMHAQLEMSVYNFTLSDFLVGATDDGPSLLVAASDAGT